MYIDFQYYLDNGGVVTDEPSFTRLNRKASIIIAEKTCGNIDKFTSEDLPDVVKLCVVDVVNEINENQKQAVMYGNSSVKSISNNGISITMNDSIKDQLNSTLTDIISTQLARVFTPDGFGILYRGVL